MRRATFAAVVLVLATFGAASPAWALCEGDPPAPKAPDSGLPGFFMQDPDVDPSLEPGDPFADPENVSLAATYGFPYDWATYDLGCGPDAARDPAAIVFTQAANFTFDFGLAAGAAAQSMQSFVYNGPLHFLDDPIESTQSAVFDKIWTVWFPVALMGLGTVVIVRAKRAAMSDNANIVLVVAVVLAGSTYLLSMPSRAADLADGLVAEGVQIVTSPFGENAPIEEQMSRAIFYPAWLEGSFGSADSAVAQAYGPDLFRSMHYSWAEWAAINEGGVAIKARIDSVKARSFEAIASELKSNYPGEYRVLIGKESTDRLGMAMISVFYAAAAAFVVIVGLGLILLAMLIIRAFIIAFPIAGLIGIYPQGRATLSKLWDYLTAAIWCVIKFAFATGLFLIVSGALLAADMPGFMKCIVLVVLTIAVLMFARPFRSAKTMVPGLDPNHSYTMGAARRVWDRRRMRQRVKDGVEDGMEDADARVANSAADDPGHEQPIPDSAEETLPPMPPPTVSYEWGEAARPRRQPSELGVAWTSAQNAGGTGPAALPAGAEPPRRPATQPGTDTFAEEAGRSYGSASSLRPWPTAAPDAGTPDWPPSHEYERRRANGGQTNGGQTNGAPANGAQTNGAAAVRLPRAALPPSSTSESDAPAGEVARPDGAAGFPSPQPIADTMRPRARPRTSRPEVVLGELLEPMYRSRGPSVMPSDMDMAVAPVDPIIAEPVIDDAGNEVFMIYTRDDPS